MLIPISTSISVQIPVQIPTQTATLTPILLECRGLAFSRNEEPIFGPLDFSLRQGEVLQILGGNGTGKTTLLRVLAGLLASNDGQIRVNGIQVNQKALSNHCAFLGHLPGHKAELSALENLKFTAALHGSCLDPMQILSQVGLAGFEDSLARHLSAGQNKRLALARLQLSTPRLWLLDEPYTNLDVDGIALVNQLITRHLTNGGAVLLTTHGAYASLSAPMHTLKLAP